MRGGIRITASFDYELEPKMSLELCTKDLRTSRICLTVSHGWPYNRLDMYAFYQIRSVKMCSERVKYVSCTYTFYQLINSIFPYSLVESVGMG